MNPSPTNDPADGPSRHSRPQRTRRVLIAAAATLTVAGGIALAVALQGGGQAAPSNQRPASTPQSTTPSPQVSVPRHNPPQSPVWGFTGSGWLDICYGPVPEPTLSKAQRAPDGQPCRPGSTRITGATQIALTARAGADTDRLEAVWSTIEPLAPSEAAARGAPRFNWAPLVSRYRAMIDDGIRPVVVAYGAPAWARAPGWDRSSPCGPGGGVCSFPPDPAHIPEWRAFLRGLMAHLPGMSALEVWNEPNFVTFFRPHPNPALYAQLLRAADQAAGQAGFRGQILTGGLSPVPPSQGKISPARFLSRVYEIDGKGSFDGIGAHPYPARAPWAAGMVANLDELRRVSEHFGDASKPIWVTEIGIGGAESGAGHFNVPLDQQGPVLERMYRAAQAPGLDVRSFLIFTLSDLGSSPSRFATYGVLTPALRPKPAYCYLAQHVGRTSACPVPRLTRAP